MRTGRPLASCRCGWTCELLLWDTRLIDDTAPFCDVPRHALVHFIRCAAAHNDAEPASLFLKLWRGQRTVDSHAERRHDLVRHAGGRRDAIPTGDDVVGESAFARGRHVLEQRIALLAGGDDDAELAGADRALESGVVIETDIDIAPQQR